MELWYPILLVIGILVYLWIGAILAIKAIPGNRKWYVELAGNLAFMLAWPLFVIIFRFDLCFWNGGHDFGKNDEYCTCLKCGERKDRWCGEDE